MEHINYPLVEKTRPRMYQMHRYYARKPPNIVATYIQKYSKKGDIVLDPFCGSGPTVVEAIRSGRKAIGVDLDPMATFITKMTAIPINLKEFEKAFKKIKDAVEDDIRELYKTKCPVCGSSAIITHVIWQNDENKPKIEKPLEIWYKCPQCGKREKKVEKEDLNKLKEIENMEIPYWNPKTKFYYPNGSPFKEGTHLEGFELLSDLYTKRNLIALSILYHEIENLPTNVIKDLMRLTFTASLAQATKMIPVIHGGKEGRSWARPRYWVPQKHFEQNVWDYCFTNRFEKTLRGKKHSNDEIKYYNEAKTFTDIKEDANILLLNHTAVDLSKIPANSVDYVFTDPPYGGAIQYLELSTLWASWLKFELDYDDEITINTSQKKDFEYYHKMLKAAFEQVYKVLKPGKWLTVTFHSTSINVWNSIIRAVVLAGFELEKIVYQPPLRPSAKALRQPYGSAVGDYYIRFKKPEREKLPTTEQIDEERYERIVIEAAKRIIAERGEPTMYQHILNGIMVELQREGALLLGEKNIEDVMKSHIDKEFILEPVEKNGKVIGHEWWFKDSASIPYLERVPLHERVERAVIDELNRRIKVSFDDILQSIFIKFPNALTPETQNIREILKEYAEKAEAGRWRLKPSVKIRMGEHGKMVFYLREIGRKAGYKVWVAPGIGSMYAGKSLYEQNEKSLSLRFIPIDHLENVKQIDAFWYKEGEIKYEFEVENTTTITEAITRGSYIPYNTKRYIVIPEEREKLLFQKLEQPLIKKNVMESKWNFIRYKDLEEVYSKSKRKSTVNPEIIKKIARMPKLKKEVQVELTKYAET